MWCTEHESNQVSETHKLKLEKKEENRLSVPGKAKGDGQMLAVLGSKEKLVAKRWSLRKDGGLWPSLHSPAFS